MSRLPAETERATAPPGIHSMPDESLLDRFLERGELEAQEAFRELTRRHGPMVLGVCRHILSQVHDAEDAFQATFLVLARKAGSIRDRRALGRWLYEVAYRVALRSRGLAARRRSYETQGAEMSSFAPNGPYEGAFDPAWNELRPVLHEEINRLPVKYREAVVLCYLEGRTNEEAAALLEWPVGTVKGRLSRARDLLRSRLTRRGLALSAALLSLRLSQNTVFAEVVPARLAESTAKSAVRFARGGPGASEALSGRVALLVEHGLNRPATLGAAVQGAIPLAMALLVFAALAGGLLTALLRSAEAQKGAERTPPPRPGLVGSAPDGLRAIGPAIGPKATCEGPF